MVRGWKRREDIKEALKLLGHHHARMARVDALDCAQTRSPAKKGRC